MIDFVRSIFIYTFSWLLPLACVSQVIPDLTQGDHYRPYYTEQQKREQILLSSGHTPRAQTPQEMYPQLYQHVNEDYMNPIRGTAGHPSNVFQNYSGFGSTQPSAQDPFLNKKSAEYKRNYEESQRQIAMAEADMAALEAQKQQSRQTVNEASAILDKPMIRYNLGKHTNQKSERYERAYFELAAMLEGRQKMDFLKATWLVESAFDVSLSWQEFNNLFQSDVQIIMQLMARDKRSPSDNLAKLMAIYQFMADTTRVQLPGKEKPVTTFPMLYDYDDYAGRKDPSKVFVSKLLRTGTGQCMSLPMLYYLYAKALGAEAHIAFAPQHTYITFKDKLGNWQDIELTGRIFTTNDFYWHSGFIKTEQVKSGIYLRPISEKETIAYLLTTLALTYVREFGTDDRLLEMALTAHKHSPQSLTPNMLLYGYARELDKDVTRQYETYQLTQGDYDRDKTAQQIEKQRQQWYDHLIKDLGYANIPDWSYKQWLEGVKQSALRNQHLVKKRQLEHQLNRK